MSSPSPNSSKEPATKEVCRYAACDSPYVAQYQKAPVNPSYLPNYLKSALSEPNKIVAERSIIIDRESADIIYHHLTEFDQLVKSLGYRMNISHDHDGELYISCSRTDKNADRKEVSKAIDTFILSKKEKADDMKRILTTLKKMQADQQDMKIMQKQHGAKQDKLTRDLSSIRTTLDHVYYSMLPSIESVKRQELQTQEMLNKQVIPEMKKIVDKMDQTDLKTKEELEKIKNCLKYITTQNTETMTANSKSEKKSQNELLDIKESIHQIIQTRRMEVSAKQTRRQLKDREKVEIREELKSLSTKVNTNIQAVQTIQSKMDQLSNEFKTIKDDNIIVLKNQTESTVTEQQMKDIIKTANAYNTITPVNFKSYEILKPMGKKTKKRINILKSIDMFLCIQSIELSILNSYPSIVQNICNLMSLTYMQIIFTTGSLPLKDKIDKRQQFWSYMKVLQMSSPMNDMDTKIYEWLNVNSDKLLYKPESGDKDFATRVMNAEYNSAETVGTIHFITTLLNPSFLVFAIVNRRIVNWACGSTKQEAFQLLYIKMILDKRWSMNHKFALDITVPKLFSEIFVESSRKDIFIGHNNVIDWIKNNFRSIQIDKSHVSSIVSIYNMIIEYLPENTI